MKQIDVVAAVIVHDDRILCVQRGPHKYHYISEKYEFPGGKVEPGETYVSALEREIQEELGMQIQVNENIITVSHIYPDFAIVMKTFICHCQDNKVTLHEHIDYKWLKTSELNTLDWAEADVPIVEKIIATL